MIEDMQLRGLAQRTQESYIRVIRQLAEHYGKPPDQLSEAELRQYFLYLKNDKHLSRSSCTQVLSALKFLYEQTLRRKWPILEFVRPVRNTSCQLFSVSKKCGGCWAVCATPTTGSVCTRFTPVAYDC
jgi:site-specific recombinase XerD